MPPRTKSNKPDAQPPRLSSRFYLRLDRERAGMFRCLLEARDNLAYSSVVDKRASILKVVCAPGREQELLETLEEMRCSVPMELLLLKQ